MKLNTIKFILTDTRARVPARHHDTDAGLDVYALNEFILRKHSKYVSRTGIRIKVHDEFVGILKPRGRHDWLIGSGVIDSGYTGELLVKLINPYSYDFVIREGDSIAQLVIVPYLREYIEYVTDEEFAAIETNRGESGGIVDVK